ncbi:ABC-2 family transporter permease [Arabiibacter massiliensis]|uniref:hypothetical protein n=1 Tax=Arabiibacter massiliensis TaxID=1870985 RepID=UPI000B423BF3|nr:hypothetical protein [Arabiibacter massiliensis]
MGARAGSFARAFRAEALKGRRGGARKVALVAPLPFCALGVLSSGVIPGMGAVGGIATNMWNYWLAIMMPVAVALICASVANLDARQKLRPVLGLPLPPARTWWAKVACALALSLGANLVVLACSTALTALGAEGPGFFVGLAAALVATACSAWMVPAALALTLRLGTLAGIAIPALTQVGVAVALWTSGAWFLFPPASTLCATAPFLGVAPSGVPLEAGDPLGIFGWEAALGIAVAVAAFALLACAGAAWFSKREAA